MSGGTISGNTASYIGGGVNCSSTFNMRGGTITGNTATKYGGGVYIMHDASFTKTGGTITGYSSDPINGNAVHDESGNVLARRGHAAFVLGINEEFKRDTTAGPGVNLSYERRRTNAGWDN